MYAVKNGELYHYGVLGMKWGVRRAKTYVRKANKARSMGRKDVAEKYTAKATKLTKKHETRAGGKKVVEYTNKQSMGKTLVKSALMSTYGTLRYNEARAKGLTRPESAAVGLVSNALNVAGGMLPSIIEPRMRGGKIENTFREEYRKLRRR